MVYSLEEKVELIALFFKNDECYNRAANLFNELHPNKFVSRKYVSEVVAKFRQTGSVVNKKRDTEREFPVRNEATAIEVLGQITADPTLSTRKLSTITNISRTTIRRILKQHKFHPYKIHLVQQLNEDDFDRRLEFCEIMTARITADQNFLFNICFSDECTFYLNSTVNRHNCRYWSDSNPRIFHEVHTQNPEKLNVWVGIFGDRLIGPIFLEDNLTGDIYLNMLQNIIYPLLVEIVEHDERYQENLLVFQQDGAPPHFARHVREFLGQHFPAQWIGRRGPMEWPARSPDLTPLDFFYGVT